MYGKLALADLISKHRALEADIRENRDEFISDWNGQHPFTRGFLGPDFPKIGAEESELSSYVYFDDHAGISDAICDFHLKVEDLKLSRKHVVAGPGSSSFLVTFSLWLLKNGYNEVFYVPPLYYTLHYFLRTLQIRLRPVSGQHAFEPDCCLNLPSSKSMLLLTDPVWYAGKRLPIEVVEMIALWQRETGSLVFVDGSFEYTQWDGTRREFTSILDPEYTLRLISPTKSLAIPSFRFAYLLHPSRIHEDLLFLYESLVGGANVTDLLFARRAMAIQSSQTGNRLLTDYFRTTYKRLVEENILTTPFIPDCGYFVFAKLTNPIGGAPAMTEDYFELRGYPGFVRVNLMAADRLYPATSPEQCPTTGPPVL